MLVQVCFGWHELKIRYCLLSVGLHYTSFSIFVPIFFTKTSRKGCSYLLYSNVNLMSLCKLLSILSSMCKSSRDLFQGIKQSSKNLFQYFIKYHLKCSPKFSLI